MMDDNTKATNLINVYITEYNSLRGEIQGRIQTQTQAFNFLLIILGAYIAALVSTLTTKPEHLPAVALAVTLLLPLISCPLAYIFFDNEMMIHAIGSYLYYDLRKRLAVLIDDQQLFASLFDFQYLPRSTPGVFALISRGRWVLFCLPTFLPLVFVPLYVWHEWGALSSYSGLVRGAAVSIYALDVYGCYILGRAIRWVFENAKYTP